MRRFALAALLATTGCANTVYRMEGKPTTPGGTAKTACEKEHWLVMAPSRAEIADPETKLAHPEEGTGLYRVGGSKPQSITSLDEDIGPSPILDRKKAELHPYDRDRIIAASLGGTGLAAIAAGTALFVTAFGSKTVQNADGTTEQQQSVSSGRAAAGGAVVGVGFALGIAGLWVNPTHAERTRANASRYMFRSSQDDPKKVSDLVQRHNSTVRRRCEAGGYSP